MDTLSIQPGSPRKWYEIWWDVWRHPGIKPFETILNAREIDFTRAFIWIGVTTLIVTLVTSLLSNQLISKLISTPISNTFQSLICGIIGSPISAIIGMVISAGIYHWIANSFVEKVNGAIYYFAYQLFLHPALY